MSPITPVTPLRKIKRNATTPHTIRAMAATPNRRISRLIKVTPRDNLRALSRALAKDKKQQPPKVKPHRSSLLSQSTRPRRFNFPEVKEKEEEEDDDVGQGDDEEDEQEQDEEEEAEEQEDEQDNLPSELDIHGLRDVETERRAADDRLSIDRRYSSMFDIADSTIGSRRDTFGFSIRDDNPSFHIDHADSTFDENSSFHIRYDNSIDDSVTKAIEDVYDHHSDDGYDGYNNDNGYDNDDVYGNNNGSDNGYDNGNGYDSGSDVHESTRSGPVVGDDTVGYDDMDEVNNMRMPEREATKRRVGTASTLRSIKRRSSRVGTRTAIPRTTVKSILKTFSTGAISSEAFEQVIEASNAFFEQAMDDLTVYAKHARRKTVNSSDVLLLLRRQRLLQNAYPYTLAHKYLPAELLNQLERRI